MSDSAIYKQYLGLRERGAASWRDAVMHWPDEPRRIQRTGLGGGGQVLGGALTYPHFPLDRIPPVVYLAIKCIKTGVVIKDQQNIGIRRDTLIDGATSREGQKGFDS